jgi:hypothetical protein
MRIVEHSFWQPELPAGSEIQAWFDAVLSELRAQREAIDQQRFGELLWSTAEVGRYFGVEAKTACGIVAASGFPDPVDAPGVGRRWIPDEVRSWARRSRRPKRSLRGSRRP